jgi:hypothetical protein
VPGPDDDEFDPVERFGPFEPEEFDPAERFGSPERDLPPRPPEPSASAEEVDPDLAAAWWTSVVLANVALGAVSVGAMLLYFRGQTRVGGALVLVGLLAGVALARTVRAFRGREDAPDDNA